MKLRYANLFMELKNSWGIDPKAVQFKQANLYLGLGLNTNYFNKWAISNFMDWGINYTKEKFAIFIMDMPHAYYNMTLENTTYEQGLIKALTKAEDLYDLCSELMLKLDSHERKKLVLLRWSDVSSGKNYMHNLEVLTEEYENNKNFAKFLRFAVKCDIKRAINKTCSVEETENLSKYFLALMPNIISGLVYVNKKSGEDTHFDTIMNPGHLINFARVKEEEFFKPVLEKMTLRNTQGSILELRVR